VLVLRAPRRLDQDVGVGKELLAGVLLFVPPHDEEPLAPLPQLRPRIDFRRIQAVEGTAGRLQLRGWYHGVWVARGRHPLDLPRLIVLWLLEDCVPILMRPHLHRLDRLLADADQALDDAPVRCLPVSGEQVQRLGLVLVQTAGHQVEGLHTVPPGQEGHLKHQHHTDHHPEGDRHQQ
jgi:hypothetical protein